MIDLAAGNTETDDRRLVEIVLISVRVHEMLEDLSMQNAKILWLAELGLIPVVLLQHHAEIIVTHIRRKIVAHNPLDSLVGGLVNNRRFQYLDQGQCTG